MDDNECIVRNILPSEIYIVKGINEVVLPENYPSFFYYDVYKNWGDIFLVAECNGRIVGYVMNRIENHYGRGLLLWKTIKVGHVISIAVLPEYRHLGLGTKLLRKSIKLMRQNYGVEKVYLEVRTSNIPAIRLYEKLGFKIKETIPHYYRDGEDAYRMELEFDYG